MSNLIKSRYVYLNEINKKVIDTNDISEKFRVLHLEQYIATDETASASVEITDGFAEGITAPMVDGEGNAMVEGLTIEQYEEIILKAKEEAAAIMNEAKLEADRNSELTFQAAKEKGYKEGLRLAEMEVNKAKKEATDSCELYKKKYEEQVLALEPKFANVLALLVEKVTGVVVEDKKDIILYLIHKAMENLYSSKSYLIHVSKEDYEFVLSKKDDIEVNGNATVEIIKDNDLKKNQCRIETDSSVIDCSLDVQLSKLMDDIKLLSVLKE